QNNRSKLVERLFWYLAYAIGTMWTVAAPWKGGGTSLKFYIELTAQELLILLAIVAAVLQISD
ncbi:MAG: hypothetical protein ACM3XM_07450, partial [Mycobacterium leprae]